MLSFVTNYRKKRYLKNLIKNGLLLGNNVYLNDGYFLDPAHCHLITIEDNVVFGPSVMVLAHDASSKKVVAKTLIARVKISKNAFVGARTIILPGVTIGENSIIGAGAVVTKSVPSNEVWVGVPARKILTIEEYKELILSKKGDDFLYSEYNQSNLTEEKKLKQIQSLIDNGSGFIK